MVIGVCYLFLQDWRATLIPTLTIPVSIFATFAVLLALGFSINILTLFGLVLAIGLVVDDAIVVVERVLYLMETEKLAPKEAAIKAMEQVSGRCCRDNAGSAGNFCAGRIFGRYYRSNLSAVCGGDFNSGIFLVC